MEQEIKEVVVTLLKSRAYLFSALHRLLGTEPVRALTDAVSSKESLEAIALLDNGESPAGAMGVLLAGLSGITDEQLEAMRMEYTRLFLGPEDLFAAPWESVYLNKHRAIFQESTLKVREWYKRYSYEPAMSEGYPDDHISLMMHFLALTSERAAACLTDDLSCGCRNLLEGQKLFEQNHLCNWLPAYAEAMDESKTRLLYPQLVKILSELIRYDGQVIDELLQALG